MVYQLYPEPACGKLLLMSKIPGLLDYFPVCAAISLEGAVAWLKSKSNPRILENELCNYLLYPQTLPVSEADLHLILALLQEILKLQPQNYYNHNLKRIVIPENLLSRFPDMNQLIWVFLDVFGKPGITTLYLKSDHLGLKALGSFIKPTIVAPSGWATFTLDAQKIEAQVGNLITVPLTESRADLEFESSSAKLFGKSKLVIQVVGGGFGLAIDMRP